MYNMALYLNMADTAGSLNFKDGGVFEFIQYGGHGAKFKFQDGGKFKYDGTFKF
jgi:hypothetical protein